MGPERLSDEVQNSNPDTKSELGGLALTRVLLYSGGWDSTLAGYLYPEAHKLYVNLHSPYSESEMAHLPKDVETIELDLFQFVLEDGYHVPQRNAILALIGAAYGMKQGGKDIEVLICGMKEDLTAPDKNPEYFKQLSDMASAFDSNSEYNITVKGFFEDDKITLWEKAGKPDIRDIVSCYSGDNCGNCLACNRRLLYLDFIYPNEYDINGAEIIKELEEEGWIIDGKVRDKYIRP